MLLGCTGSLCQGHSLEQDLLPIRRGFLTRTLEPSGFNFTNHVYMLTFGVSWAFGAVSCACSHVVPRYTMRIRLT